MGDLRDWLIWRKRWAAAVSFALSCVAGALVLAFAMGGAVAASPGLTLQSVTVDYPSSHWSPTWTYDSPDPGGTANWDTSTFTSTYSFPMPFTIPATGVTIKLGVTAYTKSTAPYNTSDVPAEGISGSLVPGGYVALNTTACGNCDPAYQTQNPNSATKTVTLTPTGGTSATITVGLQDGPTFTYTYQAGNPPPPPSSGNTARVASVQGDVTVKHADGSTEPVTTTTVLRKGDEISTGVDARAVLKFTDGVQMTVDEMTQLLVADLLNKGTRQAVTVALKLGEESAKVNPKKAFQTDFKLTTPSGVAGVRGSKMRVFYDPSSRIEIVATLSDRASFQRPGRRPITIPQGKEIAITRSGVSKLAPIGKAGARGGIDAEKARDLALAFVDRFATGCSLTSASAGALVKPAGNAWTVTIPLQGKATGNSSWKVTAGKVTAINAVAKQIAAGCP